MGRTSIISWSADDIALLGTVPDKFIANKLKIAESTVGVKRWSLKIPAFRSVLQFSESEINLLGTDSDAAIAKRLGRAENVIYKKRRQLKIPPHRPQWSGPRKK